MVFGMQISVIKDIVPFTFSVSKLTQVGPEVQHTLNFTEWSPFKKFISRMHYILKWGHLPQNI